MTPIGVISGRHYANRLIEGASTVKSLGDNCHQIKTESQARELVKVEPDKRAEVITNADKRRSVKMALQEWKELSDREIARICAVSHQFVTNIREELSTVDSCEQPSTRVGAGKIVHHGEQSETGNRLKM